MKIIDISLPLTESIVTWPGDPPFQIKRRHDLNNGDDATVSELSLGAHTGTHIDAPAHFIAGGSGVESLDLQTLIGPVVVLDVGEAEEITDSVLANLGIPDNAERLLFRTANSQRRLSEQAAFSEDFVAISEAGARWLAARPIRLLGIDYLSVAPFQAPVPTHRILLAAGIVLVEGLALGNVRPGSYQLVCLPLKIDGAEAAPARAVLIDNGELKIVSGME